MAIYAALLRQVRQLVFGCEYQMQLWLTRYSLPLTRSRVIYNGVDTNHFSKESIGIARRDLRRSFGFSDADFVVVIVGQLRVEKQHTDLVNAMGLLRAQGISICALIVGEGERREAIAELVAAKGLAESCQLIGSFDDVRPMLKAADVFVLTSTSVETFSNAALEAMAMGLPVVLSDISGAREMVDVGRNGYLYPAGDIAVLAKILADLSTRRVEACEMGVFAREIVCQRFGFHEMVTAYDGILFAPGGK